MQRCPVHDLALSPSGECVLCRRASAPPPPTSIAPLAIVVCVLVGAAGTAGALFAMREPRRIASQEIVPFATASEVAIEEPPPPSAVDPLVAERAAEVERVRGRRAARERARLRSMEPVAAVEVPVPGPPARPERLGDGRAGDPRPTTTAAPDRHALTAARRRVSITMYGAPWCGYCRRAEQWLRANSIAFVHHDVDAEPSAAQHLRRINPRGGIPAFEIDGEVLLGFSQSALEQAIDRAAARHM